MNSLRLLSSSLLQNVKIDLSLGEMAYVLSKSKGMSFPGVAPVESDAATKFMKSVYSLPVLLAAFIAEKSRTKGTRSNSGLNMDEIVLSGETKYFVSDAKDGDTSKTTLTTDEVTVTARQGVQETVEGRSTVHALGHCATLACSAVVFKTTASSTVMLPGATAQPVAVLKGWSPSDWSKVACASIHEWIDTLVEGNDTLARPTSKDELFKFIMNSGNEARVLHSILLSMVPVKVKPMTALKKFRIEGQVIKLTTLSTVQLKPPVRRKQAYEKAYIIAKSLQAKKMGFHAKSMLDGIPVTPEGRKLVNIAHDLPRRNPYDVIFLQTSSKMTADYVLTNMEGRRDEKDMHKELLVMYKSTTMTASQHKSKYYTLTNGKMSMVHKTGSLACVTFPEVGALNVLYMDLGVSASPTADNFNSSIRGSHAAMTLKVVKAEQALKYAGKPEGEHLRDHICSFYFLGNAITLLSTMKKLKDGQKEAKYDLQEIKEQKIFPSANFCEGQLLATNIDLGRDGGKTQLKPLQAGEMYAALMSRAYTFVWHRIVRCYVSVGDAKIQVINDACCIRYPLKQEMDDEIEDIQNLQRLNVIEDDFDDRIEGSNSLIKPIKKAKEKPQIVDSDDEEVDVDEILDEDMK